MNDGKGKGREGGINSRKRDQRKENTFFTNKGAQHKD